MARPLPKDVEDQIAGTARRAEIRSVAVWGFILGGVFGFALGASLFSSSGSGIYFMLGAGVIVTLWYMAAGRRKKTQERGE